MPEVRWRVSPSEELLAAAREIVIYSAGIPMEKATTEERIRAEDVAKALPRMGCVRAIVDAEVRALRRERRELRKLLKRGLVYLRSDGVRASIVLLEDIEKALAPKARRAGRKAK